MLLYSQMYKKLYNEPPLFSSLINIFADKLPSVGRVADLIIAVWKWSNGCVVIFAGPEVMIVGYTNANKKCKN